MGASLDVSVNDAFRTTVERVCRHYSLGELLGEAIRLRGSFNINVKIRTTTGNYVIRFANSSVREEHLQYVSRLLDALPEEEIPVLRPLKDEQGASIMYHEGQRIQVTPFVREKLPMPGAASAVERGHAEEVPSPAAEWEAGADSGLVILSLDRLFGGYVPSPSLAAGNTARGDFPHILFYGADGQAV